MKNVLFVKSNDLIEARYNLSLSEQKIILYAVSKLDRSQENFEVMSLKVRDFAELLGTTKERYSEIRDIIRGLRKKELIINAQEGEIITGWVSSMQYMDKEGAIELEFSRKLTPYLLQLRKKFTRYQLKNILYLKSKYSVRMYQLMKQYEVIKRRTFMLKDIKKMLMIDEDQYKRMYDFERFVLKQSTDEINEYTDINISYVKNKKGRSIDSITFVIESKEDNLYIPYLNENYNIKEFKEKSGLNDENFNSEQIIELYTIACEKLENEYDTADDLFEYIRLNYLHMLKNKTVKNKYAYLKKALKEDHALARGQIKFDYKII